MSGNDRSIKSTEFMLIKTISQTVGIPVLLDEFKASDLDQTQFNYITHLLRDAYNHKESTRGRANQTTTVYPLTSPLIVAGEDFPEQGALLDRIVTDKMNPEWITPKSKHDTAYKALCRRNLDRGLKLL